MQNTVTLGATALNNNSAAYASYAILIDQAIGQQVLTACPCFVFKIGSDLGIALQDLCAQALWRAVLQRTTYHGDLHF